MRANSLKCYWKLRLGRKKCLISLGRVAQSMVSASHWLKGIETYTVLWQLTLVSANHASRNSSLILKIRYVFQPNLTRAVNSPVAFKPSFTSAVVRSFGVVTRSILVTRVCIMAFVNVWSKKIVAFQKCSLHHLCPLRCLKTRAEKFILDRPSQQVGRRSMPWLTITESIPIQLLDQWLREKPSRKSTK